MPRYYIDLHDGTEAVRDTAGHDLRDLDAARTEALRILRGKAQDFVDQPGRHDFVAAVRDAAGAVRLRLRMSLETGPVGDGQSESHADAAAGPYPVWVSPPLKLRCFLVAVKYWRGSEPVYAVMADTSDEALAAVAAAVAPRSKLRLVGGLSKDLARHLRLKPSEVRLI